MEAVKLQRMAKAQLIEKLEHHHYRDSLFRETERIAKMGYYEWNYEDVYFNRDVGVDYCGDSRVCVLG